MQNVLLNTDQTKYSVILSSSLPDDDLDIGDGVTFGYYDKSLAKIADDFVEAQVHSLGNIDCGGTSNIGDIDCLLMALQSALSGSANSIDDLVFVVCSDKGNWVEPKNALFYGSKIYS